MSGIDHSSQWTRVARTFDGIEYRIRPIRAGDLLHVDNRGDMAFVAVAGEQENEHIIGVALQIASKPVKADELLTLLETLLAA